MPKSTKKKKDKAADFSKAKLKLGKEKQTPNNAVDTSFKARSIALPSQTITHSKSDATPTTKRRLSFEDLVSHMKHYNSGTRKDAILGIRELFENHPEIVTPSLTVLFSNCIRIIGDEDASVRKGLLAFFGWLLPRVSIDDLAPHAPVLLLFTTSALTHIFPEIRIDAIRFIDLFLEFIPDLVVEGWLQASGGHGKRVLEGYLGILSAGTAYGEDGDTGPVKATSTASVVLSPKSKLLILKSLSTFFTKALSTSPFSASRTVRTDSQMASSSQHTPSWFFAALFPSQSLFSSFDGLIIPTSTSPLYSHWEWSDICSSQAQESYLGGFDREGMQMVGDHWSLQLLGEVDLPSLNNGQDNAESSRGINAEFTYISHLIHVLHPTLVSSFLDCAPAVFSPGSIPPEIELQTVLAVAEILRCLYGAVLLSLHVDASARTLLHARLSTILGYMAPYLPFEDVSYHNARRDIKVEQSFQALNLIYCELISLLILSGSPSEQLGRQKTSTERRKSQRSSEASYHALSLQVSRVSEYVVKLLRGETFASGPQVSLSHPISSAAYTSLLPTIWALISNPAFERSDTASAVLEAVLDHAIVSPSSSSVKRHTIEFLGRLVLLETQPECHAAITIETSIQQKLNEWLTHLPRTLWELGSNNLPATEIILRLLLRLSQRKSAFLHDNLPSIRLRLAPYFTIQHATRGKLPGPFSKLPSSAIQTLALDAVFAVCSISEGVELAAAVDEVVVGENKMYWTSLYAAKA